MQKIIILNYFICIYVHIGTHIPSCTHQIKLISMSWASVIPNKLFGRVWRLLVIMVFCHTNSLFYLLIVYQRLGTQNVCMGRESLGLACNQGRSPPALGNQPPQLQPPPVILCVWGTGGLIVALLASTLAWHHLCLLLPPIPGSPFPTGWSEPAY